MSTGKRATLVVVSAVLAFSGCHAGSNGTSSTATSAGSPTPGSPAPPGSGSQTQPASGLAITPTALPIAVVGTPYSQTLLTTTSNAVDWSLSGQTPPGFALAFTKDAPSMNFLSGTPTSAGTFSFTVVAIDTTTGDSAQVTYSLAVNVAGSMPAPQGNTPPLGTLAVSPADGTLLPGATAGQPYSQTLTISGGQAPYSVTQLNQALAGLSVQMTSATTFTIAGTPAQRGGTSGVEVEISDAAAGAIIATYWITFSPPPPLFTLAPASGTSLPQGVAGQAYLQTIAVTSGGSAPYTFVGQSLPAGLSVTATSASTFDVSGTTTIAGNYVFWVQVTDANNAVETETYYVNVLTPTGPLFISPVSLPDGEYGQSYQASLTLVNATGVVVWSVPFGALPQGLQLDATGNLSGTCVQSNVFSFTIEAVDSTGATALQSYTLSVGSGSLSISPGSISDGNNGDFYSVDFSTNGVTPIQWSLSGSLPSGLSFSDGSLSGFLNDTGSFSFSVTATDATGTTGQASYSFNVN